MEDVKQTPLFDAHVGLGAKMVPFAGYSMPVQYPMGVMKEHLHCRASAGLFDVSHMGQVVLSGASWENVAAAFETLVPQDVLGLNDGRQRYGFFTNESGGIVDDLMFARRGDDLHVVVNAACKSADLALMREGLPSDVTVTEQAEKALIAIQGPRAGAVIEALDPGAADMQFMDIGALDLDGVPVLASRSGYTGEDGFEISVAATDAPALMATLLAHDAVEPIGLGARDSLRLEAGLCLYGQDITQDTTPVEADLVWAMQKVRRAGGERADGFPGASIIGEQMENGSHRKRVGLLPQGRAPMREGTVLFSQESGGDEVGKVTSGGFGPSVGGPVAMGFVGSIYATDDTPLWGEVRGKRMPLKVKKLPFVAAQFKRKPTGRAQ